MLFKKIIYFFKGYIILMISGAYCERFFNICMRRNIGIWGIRYISANNYKLCMRVSDFKKIRQVAKKTKTSVHIINKNGLFFLIKKYKHRIFFMAGFILFVLVSSVLSQFIWSVEIIGTPDNKEEILASARSAGIRVGAYKPGLPPGEEIKYSILTEIDNLTWAWVYIKGTKAIIEVREAIPKPDTINRLSPFDIVALQDGIITDILVKNGNAFCKKGDVVLKGDLLIGGTLEEKKEGGYRLRHALGDVYAATWHKAKATIKLYREAGTKTGKKKRYINLKLFSKEIPLWHKINIPYTNYEITADKYCLGIGNSSDSGIGITVYNYEETQPTKIPLEPQKAVDSACYALEEQIAKELLFGSELIDKKFDYTLLDDETAEVTLTMQFIEPIGGEIPIDNVQE